MTQNLVSYWNFKENERHNREMERLTGEKQAEEKRHNVRNEDLSLYSTNVSASNVQLGYAQLGLGYATLAENARHNVANESTIPSQIEVNYATAENKRGQTIVYNTQVGLISAQTGLAQAQTKTEKSKQFVNNTQGFSNISNAVQSVTGAFKNISGIFTGMTPPLGNFAVGK